MTEPAPAIEDFRGKYRFLSNFAYADVVLDGVTYRTTEHAFQAAKTLDPAERRAIQHAATPAEAKKLGRTVTLRADWDDTEGGLPPLRYRVMEDLVRQKFFTHPDHAHKLLDTGTAFLIEGNTWHDNTWGRCRCGTKPECDGRTGKNWLGEILMKVRSQLPSAPSMQYPF